MLLLCLRRVLEDAASVRRRRLLENAATVYEDEAVKGCCCV